MAPVFGLAERAADIIQMDYAPAPPQAPPSSGNNAKPSDSSSSTNSGHQNFRFGATRTLLFVCCVLTVLV